MRPAAAGGLDDGARIVRAVGERLFGQQMAMMGKGRKRDVAAGSRNDHVEHGVGPGLVEDRVEVGSDRRAGEVEFARPRLRPVGVEVDKPDDIDAGGLSGSLEPGFAHGSAADQDDIHHPETPPAGPSRPAPRLSTRRFRKRLP